MSHGRYKPRHPRAPVAALPDGAAHATPTSAPHGPRASGRGESMRIGPPAPGSAAQWHRRGVAFDVAGDSAGAVECYRWALRVGGPDPQIIFDLAYALADAGRPAAAAERYRQVTELDPGRQDAWLNLGDVLMTLAEPDAALHALRHAVDLDPDDAAARYDLADVLDRTRAGDARPHWRAFLRLGNGPPEHLRYAACRLAGR